MTLMLVVGLVGGGAFAYFSDVETSTGNSFAAGTLDLKLDNADGNVVAFAVANTYPSASGTYTYDLDNPGSLPGYLDIVVAVSDLGGTTSEPELNVDSGNLGDLSANMDIVVTIGVTQVYAGSLLGWNGNHEYDYLIAAGGTTTVKVDWLIPAAVGNVIQGDSTTVDLTFEFNQRTNE
jgi:spore coat-associated protein N